MLTQLPSVPSLIPSSFATRAIGRDVSITIFTASSLNSGEKLFFGRGNYFTFPDGPSYLDGLSGRLGAPHAGGGGQAAAGMQTATCAIAERVVMARPAAGNAWQGLVFRARCCGRA